MSFDVPDGLATIHDALVDTSYTKISAAAAVKQNSLNCSTQIDQSNGAETPNSLPIGP